MDKTNTLRDREIKDYYNQSEDIYLGPDENMYEDMIEWIANESKREKYRAGLAFITGKKELGIGHKAYGVTSLGVSVFMEEALRFLGINPEKDSFTVKMTGGPDGDVAGNLIVNLYKRYPSNARLVALTDVSGTIYDPQGLDLKMLVELFHKEKSIRAYPPEMLHDGGFLLDRENRRTISLLVTQVALYKKERSQVKLDFISGNEANTIFRLNVHKTPADLFLPCGGRPRTLCVDNIDEFLTSEGMPTARAIIEGANLYLSNEARILLEERGTLIIKDSSANKGGVISSSFEVLFGLLFKKEEFLELKDKLVLEVLHRIEMLSLKEATLLLKTHKETKRSTTEISDEISKRIRFFKDQILAHLQPLSMSKLPTDDPLIQVLLKYFPSWFQMRFGNEFQNHIQATISEVHQKAIIASHIAASVVYSRGLDFWPSIVDILPLLVKEII